VWSSGDHIVVRYLRDERAAWVRAVTVVEDTNERSVLFLAAGSPTKVPANLDGTPIARNTPYEQRFHLQWLPGDGSWGGNQTLLVTTTGAAHSIWLFWTETWDFLGWYVNLEAPYARTAIGVDTTDDVLDVVVSPNLEWRWKDEHLVEEWIAAGVYTREEFDAIYEHGWQAIADVEARRFPFDGSLTDWQPHPGWRVPSIHPEWHRLPGYDVPLSTGRPLRDVDHPAR